MRAKSLRMRAMAEQLVRKGIEAVAPLAGKIDDILGDLERNPEISANPDLMDAIGEVQSGNLQGGDVYSYIQTLTAAIEAIRSAGFSDEADQLDDLADQIASASEADAE